MLMKITGNVWIILPIILLLTNETEKEKKTKTNKYRKPHPLLKKNKNRTKTNYLGRKNMEMVSDIITVIS